MITRRKRADDDDDDDDESGLIYKNVILAMRPSQTKMKEKKMLYPPGYKML